MKRTGPILVEVAAADLLDRIAILQIKAERITDPRKLANVRTELQTLEAVRDERIEQTEPLDSLVRELKSVLEKGWQIEEDIRASERAERFDERFIELARSIYHTNDERSRIKRRINELLGSRIIEEKSHDAET